MDIGWTWEQERVPGIKEQTKRLIEKNGGDRDERDLRQKF